MNQSKLEEIACTWREARENESWITIGSGFTSHCMKNWLEFFKPIVSRRTCKPITFPHLNENCSPMAYPAVNENRRKQRNGLIAGNSDLRHLTKPWVALVLHLIVWANRRAYSWVFKSQSHSGWLSRPTKPETKLKINCFVLHCIPFVLFRFTVIKNCNSFIEFVLIYLLHQSFEHV